MAEVETVGLNLDGNFADEAQKSADGADRLSTSLDKVAGSASKIKAPALVSVDQRLKMLRKDADDAAAAVEKLQNRLDRLHANRFDQAMNAFLANAKTPDALTPKIAPQFDFRKSLMGGLFGAVDKLFGRSAADGLRNSLIKGVEFGEKYGEAIKGGGAVLLKAGGVLLGAAAAIAAAGAVVGVAGAKFAIEKTSEKEIQSAVFGKLGNAKGFDVALDIAGKFNIPEEKAIEQMKTLLDAKLNNADALDWERIIAGASLVRGEGKAQALLEKLVTQTKKGGKANEEAVKGFAEAGVDVDAVWANLAKKMGVSVDVAKAKVKAGVVDMKTVLGSVKEVAGSEFGGIADTVGKSVPGLFNAIRIEFGKLFSDVDLSPIEAFLGNLLDVLKGDAGGALKGAISELFGNLNELVFGQFKGEEGKKRLTNFVKSVSAGIHELAQAAKDIKPIADLLVKLGTTADDTKDKSFQWPGLGEVLLQVTGIQGAIDGLRTLGGVIDWFDGLFDDASKGGLDLGNALVDGIINGITGGAFGVIQAAIDMVQGAINGAHTAADSHSPSRKMHRLGGWMGEGLSGGMDAQNDNASNAGANMAQAAMDGASASAGGGGGARAAAAGGAVVINVYVQGGGSLSPEQIQQVKDASYEGYLRARRREGREGREGSKAT